MNLPAERPIWLKTTKELSEKERLWMCRLSQRRLQDFKKMPESNEEWVRQIETCAARIKAERGKE